MLLEFFLALVGYQRYYKKVDFFPGIVVRVPHLLRCGHNLKSWEFPRIKSSNWCRSLRLP